jgi:hypothetical protein
LWRRPFFIGDGVRPLPGKVASPLSRISREKTHYG